MKRVLSRSNTRKLMVTIVAIGGLMVVYEVVTFDLLPWGGQSAAVDPSAPVPGARLDFSATAYCKGTTTASGAEVRSAAKSIAEIDLVRKGDAVLAVAGDLTAALRRGDTARWQVTAAALDAQWFAGLGDSIERFERVRLVLPAAADTRVATLTAASRWRWFRTRKPLAEHA